ncbi:MAG: biotin--[acetyl-CoA-carboxylase] ligase [Desulfurivibrionaceae bacterium]
MICTPDDLSGYIGKEEKKRRDREFTSSSIDKIFRYGSCIGSEMRSFPFLERGMEKARCLIREYGEESKSFPSGMVISAESLGAGKGRFQRNWHAPPGGIWITVVIVNTLLPRSSRLLPLAAGVACCETAVHFGLPASIKWVNDVQTRGRKTAGILTETTNFSGEEYVLLGIGINVNNSDFPAELSDSAISFRDYLGGECDRKMVLVDLLAKLSWNVGLLHFFEALQLAGEEDSGHPLIRRYNELSDSPGRRVLFGFNVEEESQYEAEVLGIDEEGGLQMRISEEDRIITEYSGEIRYLS